MGIRILIQIKTLQTNQSNILKMDNVKKLELLVLKTTSQSVEQIPASQLAQILQLLNSRVDMPKHVIASISKRMAIKNKRVLINIFTLLQYLAYECELSLYSQISTKQFLFKISGLLMNKQIDQEVKTKAMQTIYCWQQLFRPHQDLLPLFFQFYAGMLRNGFDIPSNYRSPFRPAQLKQYKKVDQISKGGSKNVDKRSSNDKQLSAPSITQKKTFEQIRQKLILTNQIIDNANPGDNIKDNGLLLQMIQQVRECQKKVSKTINENPSQAIMQLALATNDDILITYRRFKDLQKNRKPEPFILTELASDIIKQKEVSKTSGLAKSQKMNEPKSPVKKQLVNILDFEQPKKVETKVSVKKQQNIFDMDFVQQPAAKKQQAPPKGDIFDLLGDNPSTQPVQKQASQGFNIDLLNQPSMSTNANNNIAQNLSNLGNFDDLLKTGNYQGIPDPSGYGISLNVNDFRTQADIKQYNNVSPMDKLDQLASDFLKK